jgi:hypothetical protein
MKPAQNYDKPDSQLDPWYRVDLACPICGQVRPQPALRARQALAIEIRTNPFLRAFCWSEGHSRLEISPLYFGICLCPHCRFPGIEADFRIPVGESHPHVRSHRRMFLEEQAGIDGPLATLLGLGKTGMSRPELSIRLTLAAIRTEMFVGPERWRRRELGRLYLHLFWLFLDEGHFSWEGLRPLEAPQYREEGPNRARLEAILTKLEPFRSCWPDIPLTETIARAEALRFHREAYELRLHEPGPEEAVLEERLLGQLFGLCGQFEQARDLYSRARQTCVRKRNETVALMQAAWDGAVLTLAERRRLTATIRTLTALLKEITEEQQDLFGLTPTDASKAGASGGAKGQAHARPGTKPAGPGGTVPPAKKKFGLFG